MKTTTAQFDIINSGNEIYLGKKKWLLLIDSPLSGKENMERDENLLEYAHSFDNALPVLRFFMWNPPAVSIGFNQLENQIDKKRCESEGIDIVRRPTGGRAIFHHTELTYSVTLPPSHEWAKLSTLQTYNLISLGLASGLRKIGIPVKLAQGKIGPGTKSPSCFSSTSQYELLVDGKKLVGSAQRRKNGAVLQQGSIIAGPQYLYLAELVSSNKDAVRKELLEHSTCIQNMLGYIPDWNDIIKAIIEGFNETLSDSG